MGTSLSVGFFNFSVQGVVSHDTKGNISIQGTVSGGIKTSVGNSFSVGSYNMYTNAKNTDSLNGTGYQLGGSVTAPIPNTPMSSFGGIDFNIMPNEDKTFYGVSDFKGISFPAGLNKDFHVQWGETQTVYSFNVYSAAQFIYVKIMEW